MILHILSDKKVAGRTIEMFDSAFPGCNKFVRLYDRRGAEACKKDYLNLQPRVKLFNIDKDIWTDREPVDWIILHALSRMAVTFVNRYYPDNGKVCWIVYGNDLYNNLIRSRGYRIFSPENSYNNSLSVKRFLISALRIDRYVTRKKINFIKERVSAVSSCQKEVDMMNEYLGDIGRKEIIEFFYYPIDVIIPSNIKEQYADSSGRNIICGNSASYTNNHEYVLNILSNLVPDKCVINMPLSYGGDERYISNVISLGESLFPNHFSPIREFMALDKYSEWFISASFYVHGSWRGEGFGNIIMAIYLGLKVFLSSHNIIYHALVEKGYVVYCLESATKDDFSEPLSAEQRLHNRTLSSSQYSKDRLIGLIRQYFY